MNEEQFHVSIGVLKSQVGFLERQMEKMKKEYRELEKERDKWKSMYIETTMEKVIENQGDLFAKEE